MFTTECIRVCKKSEDGWVEVMMSESTACQKGYDG